MIRGDVPNAVAARLNGMHLHGRKQRENVRYALERRPIELDVLTRREMAVAFIEFARDACKHAQLPSGQQTVRHRDAQHRRVPLNIEAVAQSQRAKIVLRELPGEETLRLIAKLRNSLVNEPLIDLVVNVHPADSSPGLRSHEIAFGYVGMTGSERRTADGGR